MRGVVSVQPYRYPFRDTGEFSAIIRSPLRRRCFARPAPSKATALWNVSRQLFLPTLSRIQLLSPDHAYKLPAEIDVPEVRGALNVNNSAAEVNLEDSDVQYDEEGGSPSPNRAKVGSVATFWPQR